MFLTTGLSGFKVAIGFQSINRGIVLMIVRLSSSHLQPCCQLTDVPLAEPVKKCQSTKITKNGHILMSGHHLGNLKALAISSCGCTSGAVQNCLNASSRFSPPFRFCPHCL